MKSKKYIKSLFFLIFLLSTLFISLPSMTKGVLPDSIEYILRNDNLYNSTNPVFNESTIVNIRNSSEYTGIYNATYSFTNDDDGTIPNDWISVGGLQKGTIINNFSNHGKILQVLDDSNTETVVMRVFLNPLNDTIFEMWLAKNSTTSNTDVNILLLEGGSTIVSLSMTGNDLTYFSGSEISIKNNFIIPNQWFHLKLILNDTFNSFDAYINNILEGNNLNYNTPSSTNGVDLFDFRTNSGHFGYSGYLDALNFNSEIINTQIFNFDDDIPNTVPNNWEVIEVPPFISVRVIESIGGFTNSLRLRDLNNSGSAFAGKNFTNDNNQLIEFYIAKGILGIDTDTTINILIDTDFIISLIFRDNDLYHLLFGLQLIKADFLVLDTFVKIEIQLNDFEHTYNILIDDVLEGIDISYNISGITSNNRIEIITDIAHNTNIFYFDNMSISSFAKVGLNIIPFLQSNQPIKEVNKFEFDMINSNILYDIGTDNPSGWSDIENGFDHTNIAQDNTNIPLNSRTNNRVVQIEGIGTNPAISGIEKDFNISSGIFNITIKYNYSKNNNDLGSFYIQIFSQDLQQQVKINTTFVNGLFGNKLEYRNSSLKNIVLLDITESTIFINQEITYNIYIDSYVIFKMTTNGSLGFNSYNFTFPLINPEHSGLGKILILSDPTSVGGTFQTIELQNVGVYHNGISLSDDFGYLPLRLNKSGWLFQQHNLIKIKANGTFGMFSASHDDWIFGGNMETISSMDTHTSTLKTINVYFNIFEHFPPTGIFDPIIIFFIKTQFNISSITINGIKFIDDTPHDFGFISYESGGVDNNESYFFMETDNILQFIHNTDDLNINEFIQAELIIGGVNTNGTAIKYTSNKNNLAFGFFRVNYVSLSSIFELPSIQKTSITLLPNDLSIISLIILITDNNDNSLSGSTSGFVKDISLLFTDETLVEIITLSLVSVLIPLIIIIIPSLGFSIRIGKFTFIPFFLLMSIVLTISGMIPFWLIFIIVISLSTTVLQKNEVDF